MFKLIIFVLIAAYSSSTLAANYSLEGTLKDGTIVSYDSDPPGYVAVKKHVNAKPEEIEIFQQVECGLIFGISTNFEISRENSYFSCTSSSKSPLAGTKYKFQRHVGDHCVTSDDYDIYTCIIGCNKNAPKDLIMSGYCGP